ncbi:MAG: glucose 1-dehydrogenase [Candidatus Hodarchaeota archaeon]
MGKLDGKIAIITGGVSGIGEAGVRLFAKEGAKVIIADIQDEYGEKLAKNLGPDVNFIHTDVTDEKNVRAVIRYAKKEYNRLDCMYNNAGFDRLQPEFATFSTKAFDSIIAVHLRGTFLGMKYAIKLMQKQGSGCIINTGSVAGLSAGYASHAYSAAKAAIIHMTRTVAREVGELGIRVNCICPGGIATAVFGRGLGLTQERALELIPKIKPILAQIQPIKRAGLPEDIAKAAVWLASEDSSFVNGSALLVDGGLTTGPPHEQSEKLAEDVAAALGVDLETFNV